MVVVVLVVLVLVVRVLRSSCRICLRFLFRRAAGFQWGNLKGLGRGVVSRGSRMGLGIGCWGAMGSG